jgi:hypothetical protein
MFFSLHPHRPVSSKPLAWTRVTWRRKRALCGPNAGRQLKLSFVAKRSGARRLAVLSGSTTTSCSKCYVSSTRRMCCKRLMIYARWKAARLGS